jgi:hypothetical protein
MYLAGFSKYSKRVWSPQVMPARKENATKARASAPRSRPVEALSSSLGLTRALVGGAVAVAIGGTGDAAEETVQVGALLVASTLQSYKMDSKPRT